MILHQNHSFYSYFTTFTIQYIHRKLAIFDVFSSVYDIGISIYTWDSSRDFLEIYNSLIKIIFNNQIFPTYEKDKELKRGESDDQAQLI